VKLPDGTHVGTVRLQVADLDRSLRYYERVLGLAELNRTDGAVALGVPPGLPLVELHQRRGVAPVPRRGRLGLYHFALLLPERAALGSFVQHLDEAGVRAGMSDHLVSEAIYLWDPDGLGIEVYSDRPKESWQYDGDELVMATEPLDVADLIAAAGGTRWSAAPAGTAMGHVHLHVGDLGRSAAFYHRGLGLEPTVWSYPGALFMSAGGYHHHLGTNTWAHGAPPATDADARLLEWEVVVPTVGDALAALERVAGEAPVNRNADGGVAQDPWGTTVRLRAAS
jgi:catechol 2,3-dioxygenase